MSDMETTVMGSIECIVGEESRSITVEAATTGAVPTIAAAVWNLRDVTAADAESGSVACWTAVDPIGAPARVVLWEEPPLPGPFPQPEDE